MRRLLKALGNKGTTLFELLTVVAVVGVSAGTAISRLSAGARSIDSVNQELTANLRLCRMQAIATGFHYRVNATSTSTYSVERMLPPATQGGNWTTDTSAVRTVNLPNAVRLGATGRYEFDTRGAPVGTTATAAISLTDSSQQRSSSVSVWPSGQVL